MVFTAARYALRVCRVWESSLSSWAALAYAAAELACVIIGSSIQKEYTDSFPNDVQNGPKAKVIVQPPGWH
jgi:hypothetical protein